MNEISFFINCVYDNNPEQWNNYRISNHSKPTFKNIDFEAKSGQLNFNNFNLSYSEFIECSFSNILSRGSSFTNCKFLNCKLNNCHFKHSNFEYSVFENSILTDVRLKNCHFNGVGVINNSKLLYVNLYGSSFIEARFQNSSMAYINVYGANFWNVTIENCTQENILIHQFEQNEINVNDIETAYLINLLSNNQKFKNLFDSTKSSFVLILGRFSGHHYEELVKIKQKLTTYGTYTPIIFDWEKSENDNLDLVETIILLGGLSRFIIANITSPKSIPGELQAILAQIAVPVIPIINVSEKAYSIFSFTSKYNWVSGILKYDYIDQIIDKFEIAIIERAEKMVLELSNDKAFVTKEIHVKNIQ